MKTKLCDECELRVGRAVRQEAMLTGIEVLEKELIKRHLTGDDEVEEAVQTAKKELKGGI